MNHGAETQRAAGFWLLPACDPCVNTGWHVPQAAGCLHGTDWRHQLDMEGHAAGQTEYSSKTWHYLGRPRKVLAELLTMCSALEQGGYFWGRGLVILGSVFKLV